MYNKKNMMLSSFNEHYTFFMKKALDEAIKAYESDEVPIGAVLVKENRIIGRGYNMCKTLHDSTAHAEMIAISSACETLHSDQLSGTQLFVTVEPCAMCAGAVINAKINQIIFGTREIKYGACGSVLDLFDKKYFNHHVQIIDSVMEEDARLLMQNFFASKRMY